MSYTKVATNIETVGQLKGLLTQFGNKDKISLSGMSSFSAAVDENGIIIFDDDKTVEELTHQ